MSEREEIVLHASDERVGKNLGVVSNRWKRGEDAEYYPSAPLALPRRPHHIHSSLFYLDFPDLIYPQCLSLFTRLPSLPLSSFIAHLQAEQSRRHQLVKVPVARDYLLVYFCLIFLVSKKKTFASFYYRIA